MTKERIQAIIEALESNEELKKNVLGMAPAEAAEELKKAGYDFSSDELIEFSEAIAEITANSELNAEELDSVAGGEITVLGLLAGYSLKVCYDIGKAIGKKW